MPALVAGIRVLLARPEVVDGWNKSGYDGLTTAFARSSCALATMALRLWRIVTGPHPVWSGEGARLFGQRWNPPGFAAIYTGTSFAVCLVEVLVHANRKAPPSAARFVEAVVPDDSCEAFDPTLLPDWDDLRNTSTAQAFGRAWIEERRSVLLIVPSIVTAGRDTNVIVNPDHPDAKRIEVGPEAAVTLDRRLFGA